MLSFFLGFSMALFGSLHCIGMCSPMLFLIKAKFYSRESVFSYHLGRSTSYLILGIFAGATGIISNNFFKQSHISLFLGIVLIISSCFSVKLNEYLTNIFHKIIPQKNGSFASYWFGIANGLLPCGLVYAALAASFVQKDFFASVLFMVGFSFATYLALNLGNVILKKFPLKLSKKYIVILVGLILILKGLELGIPYLSPSFSVQDSMNNLPLKFCK